MKHNIKEIKEILYRLEDITSLGVSLPLVAFTQLRKHVEALSIDDEGLRKHKEEVLAFINKHMDDFNEKDERAICRAFQRMKKKNPDRLNDYRLYYERKEALLKLVTSL